MSNVETSTVLDLGAGDIAALEILASVINSHSIVAEDADITISALGPNVAFRAHDDDFTLLYRTTRPASAAYSVALNARRLVAVTRDEISASVEIFESSADVLVDQARLVVPGHEGAAYPVWTSEPLAETSEPARAIEHIEAVAGCASTAEARGAILMSTLFSFNPDWHAVRIVATDGYRIMMDSFEATSARSAKFILPSRTATLLSAVRQHRWRFGGFGTRLMEIRESKRAVHFCFGPFELVARFVDGRYPDYYKVTDETAPSQFLIVERGKLLRALQRVCSISTNRSTSTIVTISQAGEITLKVFEPNTERDSVLEISAVEATVQGNIGIALNAALAADVVGRLRGDNIAIGFVDHKSPLSKITFRDIEELGEFVPFTGAAQIILMPMREQ